MAKYTTCVCCGFTVESRTVRNGLCPYCAPRRDTTDILLLWTVILTNAFLWAGILYLANRFLEVF